MERQRSIRRSRRSRSYQPLSKKIKDCIRNFLAFIFSNVGIIGLVVGYVIAGAVIFMEIEGSVEREHSTNMEKNRLEVAEKFWQLVYTQNVFDEALFKENVSAILIDYQNITVTAIQSGYDGTDSANYSNHWSFSGAFLYSLTVITTIGYGNVVPRTSWGKIATIVYAIIGMPLFLLYLSNIGDIMARSFKWIYATCYLCKGCPGVSKRRAERRRLRAQQYELEYGGPNDDERSENSWERNAAPDNAEGGSDVGTEVSEESFDAQTITVPITVCLSMMVGYILGGALLFMEYEAWNWVDGPYFCFISLSTIGFGDLVPGDKIYSSSGSGDVSDIFDVELSFIFCSMYLMLGMALIAMCFNLMQEEVIHKFRTIVSTMKYICRCNR